MTDASPLGGAPAETVDAEAKDLATKQLAQLVARKPEKKPATPAAVQPGSPAPAPPPETPERIAQPGACSAVAPARIAAQKNA
jgi:hypothetical protein